MGKYKKWNIWKEHVINKQVGQRISKTTAVAMFPIHTSQKRQKGTLIVISFIYTDLVLTRPVFLNTNIDI